MKSKLVHLLALVLAACALGMGSEPELTPHVDARIELLSIVFRLTREGGSSNIYNQNFLKRYTNDIDDYFAPYKDHPAVLLAKSLADKDDFDITAPMQIAVRISPPPALEPLLPFTDDFPGDGFSKENALLFVQRLREFYRDTHFEKFLTAHDAMYRLAEDRFLTVSHEVDLNWFKSFYGDISKSNFTLILGMNNGGGNSGAQFTGADGREERFCIMGAWTADSSGNPTYDQSYIDYVIHEFNHSFVNPVYERHKTEFASAQKLYEQVKGRMQEMDYPNSDVMVYESLVRVNVILYLESRGRSHAEIQAKIREEQDKGFRWMDGLYSLLHQYTSERSRYPNFDSFMPVVARFYRELLPRLGPPTMNPLRRAGNRFWTTPSASAA